MKRVFLFIIFVTLHIPVAVNATVIEFNGDGSVTTFVASDYLAASRHQEKKPQVSKFHKNWQPKSNFDHLIEAAALKYSLDKEIIHAIIETESRYRVDAVSPKGAQGLMQLMPSTAKLYGITDPFDPSQNINAGTKHLKYLLDRYRGDLPIAVAAYNAGEGAVEKYNGIPPYQETINYVEKITDLLGNRNDLPSQYSRSLGSISTYE